MRDAESVVTTVSSGEGGGFMGGSAEGNVTITFVDFDQRSTDVFETLRRLQAGIGTGIAGADVKVEKPITARRPASRSASRSSAQRSTS
jgi:hypothetical protein